MKFNLINIKDAGQLSECPTAILLDVFTPENEIEGFLKLAKGILKTQNAVLVFNDEPYFWFNLFDEFSAYDRYARGPDVKEILFFDGEYILDQNHTNYERFSSHIADIGVEHKRIISFDLRKKNSELSYGRVTFFDMCDEYYEQNTIDLAADFIQQMIKFIAIKFENAELKESYEQQAAINTSKTKFFQIIAHDLRAPFHGLLGFSEVLSDERETLQDQDIQKISEYLHDTAQSTYNLLENLLNWAMAEEGQFVYHPIRFKLIQVAEIVYKILSPLAMKKHIQLIYEIPEDIVVIADINMVTSVIQNLVSNALKFTHVDGTGKVHFKASEHGDVVEVLITDSGLGMSAHQVSHIFQPSIKVSQKGTSGEKGTGLGLVLCKHFLDLNHGEIEVKSKMGVGTTFKVTLPSASNKLDYEI